MLVFTDIHGYFDTFIALLAKIPDVKKRDGIAIAGDLIDRGPKSKQIVQYCIDNKIKVVRGNHEEMMIVEGLQEASYFMKNGTYNQSGGNTIWGLNGGFETMDSYMSMGDDGKRAFDMSTFIDHIEWMKTLPYFIEFKDVKNPKDGKHLLVSHSSAASVWKWSDKIRKEKWDMFVKIITWSRPHQINDIPDIFNIFGHTPIENGPKIRSCYANIDTGCFYEHKGYFKLTTIDYPSMEIFQHENVDKGK